MSYPSFAYIKAPLRRTKYTPDIMPSRQTEMRTYILGGWDLGVCFSLFLQGVLCAQFAHYTSRNKRDLIWIKLFVAGPCAPDDAEELAIADSDPRRAHMKARWAAADQEPATTPARLAPHEQSVAVIPHRFNACRVVRGGEAPQLYCETGRIPEKKRTARMRDVEETITHWHRDLVCQPPGVVHCATSNRLRPHLHAPSPTLHESSMLPFSPRLRLLPMRNRLCSASTTSCGTSAILAFLGCPPPLVLARMSAGHAFVKLPAERRCSVFRGEHHAARVPSLSHAPPSASVPRGRRVAIALEGGSMHAPSVRAQGSHMHECS
ncbi:hypothetical protein B0H14DRAFT_3736137 [Mycena olivaceomarginata]|nr:hypothetical protein B0H14DRAFT_3736137 [Mycena olivaceomarginata]